MSEQGAQGCQARTEVAAQGSHADQAAPRPQRLVVTALGHIVGALRASLSVSEGGGRPAVRHRAVRVGAGRPAPVPVQERLPSLSAAQHGALWHGHRFWSETVLLWAWPHHGAAWWPSAGRDPSLSRHTHEVETWGQRKERICRQGTVSGGVGSFCSPLPGQGCRGLARSPCLFAEVSNRV